MEIIHVGQVRGRKTLARFLFVARQLGDEGADVLSLFQEVFTVGRADQVIKNGADDDRQAILFQLSGDSVDIQRHEAVGAEFDARETGFAGFFEHALPAGQVGIFWIIDAPATGCTGNADAHGFGPPDGRIRHLGRGFQSAIIVALFTLWRIKILVEFVLPKVANTPENKPFQASGPGLWHRGIINLALTANQPVMVS